ncbi:MAG: nucleoside-binding protein [Acidobacteria bacterium]|nr:nucleoside-binding protein [Acidobacteriota bacterium]
MLRWVVTAFLVLATPAAAAAQAEFHYQYGKLANPFSGARENTSILTVQHAAGWRLGDSFFFLDILNDGLQDGFNDKDLYGEWYPTLSLGKVSGKKFQLGPIRDISVIGGLNFGADANVLKYLPGVRASWKVPGFAFLNTDVMAYIDGNSGASSGGAPRTSNSFTVDVNWALPFRLGSQSFLMGGHAEYIGASTDEFGNRVKGWILAQPQLTWDLGAAFGAANHLLVGIEYQYWRNKLGVEEDEYAPQLLLIWRF